MSIYGHANAQYYGKKISFPKESFTIAGISNYQDYLKDKNNLIITFESKLTLKPEPDNKYDPEAIQIQFNNNCIGYVPKNPPFYKKICKEQLDSNLKIITIKKEKNSDNYGIRVILEKYYSEDLVDKCIF